MLNEMVPRHASSLQNNAMKWCLLYEPEIKEKQPASSPALTGKQHLVQWLGLGHVPSFIEKQNMRPLLYAIIIHQFYCENISKHLSLNFF